MKQEQKAEELGYKYFPDEENIWARDNVEAVKTMAACLEMSNFIIDKACEWLKTEYEDIGIRWMRGDGSDELISRFIKAMKGD